MGVGRGREGPSGQASQEHTSLLDTALPGPPLHGHRVEKASASQGCILVLPLPLPLGWSQAVFAVISLAPGWVGRASSRRCVPPICHLAVLPAIGSSISDALSQFSLVLCLSLLGRLLTSAFSSFSVLASSLRAPSPPSFLSPPPPRGVGVGPYSSH